MKNKERKRKRRRREENRKGRAKRYGFYDFWYEYLDLI